MTQEIKIYHANMSDVSHFFNCKCFLLKNKSLQFRLATFPQKAPTVLSTIWSGQMLHLQLYVDRKLLDHVHHYTWHGPMVFFNKLFSLSLSVSVCLSLSFFEDLSLYIYIYVSHIYIYIYELVPKGVHENRTKGVENKAGGTFIETSCVFRMCTMLGKIS